MLAMVKWWMANRPLAQGAAVLGSDSFWNSGTELGGNSPYVGAAENNTTAGPDMGFGTPNQLGVGFGPSLGWDAHYFETQTNNHGTWNYWRSIKFLLFALSGQPCQ